LRKHDDMRTFAILVLVGLGLLVAAGTGCSHGPANDEEGPSAVEVTVTQVERGDISNHLKLSGTVTAAPNHDIRVSSLVAGRITEMKVAEGDRVGAGELLARLDARPYQDQLDQAEAALAQAQANLKNASAIRKRNEDLEQRGIAARKDLEEAQTQESVAQSALKQTEAAVALAQRQVARTAVHSPLSGFVIKRFVSTGEQVDGTAGQPVVEVANLDDLELVVNVPAPYLADLRSREPLALTADAFPNKTFAGHVVAVPAAVDPSSSAGAVRIRLANPGNLLRLGMFLKTELPFETHHQTLLIPAQALYHDEGNHPVVYRVEGDNATGVPVKIGVATPDKVEILDGVKAGDTVILTGGYGLSDKARVKVKAGDAR
jgi:RND family efflux transporter MFP subunit